MTTFFQDIQFKVLKAKSIIPIIRAYGIRRAIFVAPYKWEVCSEVDRLIGGDTTAVKRILRECNIQISLMIFKCRRDRMNLRKLMQRYGPNQLVRDVMCGKYDYNDNQKRRILPYEHNYE
jgi:hypothetical protein